MKKSWPGVARPMTHPKLMSKVAAANSPLIRLGMVIEIGKSTSSFPYNNWIAGSSRRLSWRERTVSIIVKPTAVKPYIFRNDIKNPKPSNSMIMISRKTMYSYMSIMVGGVFVVVRKSTKSMAWAIPKRVANEQIMVGSKE